MRRGEHETGLFDCQFNATEAQLNPEGRRSPLCFLNHFTACQAQTVTSLYADGVHRVGDAQQCVDFCCMSLASYMSRRLLVTRGGPANGSLEQGLPIKCYRGSLEPSKESVPLCILRLAKLRLWHCGSSGGSVSSDIAVHPWCSLCRWHTARCTFVHVIGLLHVARIARDMWSARRWFV